MRAAAALSQVGKTRFSHLSPAIHIRNPRRARPPPALRRPPTHATGGGCARAAQPPHTRERLPKVLHVAFLLGTTGSPLVHAVWNRMWGWLPTRMLVPRRPARPLRIARPGGGYLRVAASNVPPKTQCTTGKRNVPLVPARRPAQSYLIHAPPLLHSSLQRRGILFIAFRMTFSGRPSTQMPVPGRHLALVAEEAAYRGGRWSVRRPSRHRTRREGAPGRPPQGSS